VPQQQETYKCDDVKRQFQEEPDVKAIGHLSHQEAVSHETWEQMEQIWEQEWPKHEETFEVYSPDQQDLGLHVQSAQVANLVTDCHRQGMEPNIEGNPGLGIVAAEYDCLGRRLHDFRTHDREVDSEVEHIRQQVVADRKRMETILARVKDRASCQQAESTVSDEPFLRVAAHESGCDDLDSVIGCRLAMERLRYRVVQLEAEVNGRSDPAVQELGQEPCENNGESVLPRTTFGCDVQSTGNSHGREVGEDRCNGTAAAWIVDTTCWQDEAGGRSLQPRAQPVVLG